MFWAKRKNSELRSAPSLQSLATELGIERRINVRCRYPQSVLVCKLPQIYFQDCLLEVRDISVGGCCIWDPKENLGPMIGQDIELNIHWSTVVETVRARIVSRVDHRRHVQFLNLSPRRQSQLVKSMSYGVRALSLTRHANASDLGPTIQAVELWSSPLNDSVLLENDVHRLAQVYVCGEQFVLYREAWPSKSPGGKCSRAEYEQLILFIANIPRPSNAINGLLKFLESQLESGDV